jgi:hypothetical protein
MIATMQVSCSNIPMGNANIEGVEDSSDPIGLIHKREVVLLTLRMKRSFDICG